jgi:CDP-glycerol glycerophosphotransferase (TagB/SpsB family)
MAYSSVLTHGVPLVNSLLTEGLRVVYRPHPRTGANRREVAAADADIRALFGTPQATGSGSRVVTDVPLEEAFSEADALITDVSSLAVEWLPTGRPLVVTVPAEPDAVVTTSPLLAAVPRLQTADAADAGSLVRSRLNEDRERSARAALTDYYLGDTTDGAALSRFLDSCTDVLQTRDVALDLRRAMVQ